MSEELLARQPCHFSLESTTTRKLARPASFLLYFLFISEVFLHLSNLRAAAAAAAEAQPGDYHLVGETHDIVEAPPPVLFPSLRLQFSYPSISPSTLFSFNPSNSSWSSVQFPSFPLLPYYSVTAAVQQPAGATLC